MALLRRRSGTRGSPVDGAGDAIDVAGSCSLDPDGIVVSPGPGTPEEAGGSVDVFAETAYPTFVVPLGHQALCVANGAPLGHAHELVRWKPPALRHDGSGLFERVSNPFEAGRSHSLPVERRALRNLSRRRHTRTTSGTS